MQQISYDMTIEQVAQYFGVSVNTVYKMIRHGDLPKAYKRRGNASVFFGESIRKAEKRLIEKAEKNMRP